MFSQIFQKSFRRGADVLHAVRTAGFAADPDRLQVIWGAKTYILFVRYLRDIQRVEYVFCLLFRRYKEIVKIMFIKKNFFFAYFKKVKIENLFTRYPAGGVCFLSPV